MIDVFKECRERVSAEDAARRYGIEFDRHRKAKCPFHHDVHPSMTFKNGRFRCWSCNTFGDCVDLTGRLLGLEPMAAAERLNADFALDLPIHRRQTPQERAAAARMAARRKELSNTAQAFETWRSTTLDRLNTVFRMAHLALKECRDLTEQEMLAVKWEVAVEHWADCLLFGDMAEQMEVFRERGQIGRLCEKILNNSLMKSNAA